MFHEECAKITTEPQSVNNILHIHYLFIYLTIFPLPMNHQAHMQMLTWNQEIPQGIMVQKTDRMAIADSSWSMTELVHTVHIVR